jgi:hypothetical protein
MEVKIKRRSMLYMLPLLATLTACAHTAKPQSDRELKGMGMVVTYELAPGASNKKGLQAISDAGNQVFSVSTLNPKNGGTSAIAGGSRVSFPRWVGVTWRENTTPGEYWTTGTIIGNYQVEVLNRIPEAIFAYVADHPGSTIVLRFRIKDDGVLFGWSVQQKSLPGAGFSYTLHGGDF